MAMIAPFRLFLRGGREGEATLDQPINNFDTIGIPQGAWSSGFCACYENIIPSCLLSFCCPCFQWAQVTVRSQIPLLISIKNSLPWIKRSSGYGFFVEYFFWSFVLCLALILILALVDIRPRIVWALVMIVLLVISIPLLYLVGHTRTAFKEK